MDFGVVLQTNPPAWRTVQLAELSEAHGFDYVWTFDSHLLWQEPYVIYSQILARTNRVMVGPMVTNPATRDWTVTASLFATLNEMFGNRTICGIGRGDSAVRVTNGRPTTIHELREATHVIRELANCRPVDYKGSTLQFPWARTSALEVWVAAYGPMALRATGEVGDGYILQLADVDIAAWMIDSVRTAASNAGRDPDAITFCVAAPMYVGEDWVHMRDQCRWFGGMVGNHIADIVAKYGDNGKVPQALTDYIKGRGGAMTTTNMAAQGTSTPPSCRTRSWTASACWAPLMTTSPSSSSSRTSASTSSPATCSTTTRKRRFGSTAKRSCPRCVSM
jgi:probable F420-dependent oxidoreductase